MKIEIGSMRVVLDGEGFVPRVEGESAEARVSITVDGMTGELRLRLAEAGSGFDAWGTPSDWLRGDLLAHLQSLADMARIHRQVALEGIARTAGQLATEQQADITELHPGQERFTVVCPFAPDHVAAE